MKTYSYYLPSEKGEGWGKFVIDESGYFSAVSDYGNYAFNWGSFGEKDFRIFLCNLNWDYLAGKLGRRDFFDGPKTEKAIKLRIVELRKENNCTKEKAREVWDDIPNKHDGERDFSNFLENKWNFFEDICGIMDYDYPPSLMEFSKRLYPRFVEELKKEMASEASR